MLVALCRLDVRVPGCTSLKEKRHVVKTLTSSLRAKFNVAVAEVDHQDLWQRATFGVSAVAGEGHHLRRVMHEVQRHVERFPGVEVIDATVSMHSPDD
ncbi:MAG TPA: DUF503 domain-containing protein [Actinomycetota bacterium]|jgi:hypothetical protein